MNIQPSPSPQPFTNLKEKQIRIFGLDTADIKKFYHTHGQVSGSINAGVINTKTQVDNQRQKYDI